MSYQILVADDSEIFRTALCTLLQRVLNLDVVMTAQDGEEALWLLEETTPDILILDINMPKLNGWEVLRQLHNRRSPVKILVLRAHANPELAKCALALGAHAWVPKGEISLFIKTLQSLLPAEQMEA